MKRPAFGFGAIAAAALWACAPVEESATTADFGQTREAVIDLVSTAASENRSLSGVQVNEYEVFIECTSFERVHELTDKWPAVLGLELMFIIEYPPYRDYFLKRAREHAARGGLVAITWHARNPLRVCPRGEYYMCSQSPMDEEALERLLDPSTDEHALWRADVDAIAEVLKEMRAMGIAPLFRPYHEMNGGWFWWGRKEGFVRLWRALHEALAVEHGLDNLVWVWSSDKASEGAARYFPGEDYVDFVGADLYAPARTDSMYETARDNIVGLHSSGIFAFTEIGLLPSVQIFERTAPAWFLLWGGEFIDRDWAQAPCPQCNEAGDVAEIFALDRVITADRLDWPAAVARYIDRAAASAPPARRCPSALLGEG